MIFKEEDDDGRERVTEEEERVSILGESQSNSKIE